MFRTLEPTDRTHIKQNGMYRHYPYFHIVCYKCGLFYQSVIPKEVYETAVREKWKIVSIEGIEDRICCKPCSDWMSQFLDDLAREGCEIC